MTTKIKWHRVHRLGREPKVVGRSDDQPCLIFLKDKDGKVYSRPRKTKAPEDRSLNIAAEQRFLNHLRTRCAEIGRELSRPNGPGGYELP